jgi:hypothetical protein
MVTEFKDGHITYESLTKLPNELLLTLRHTAQLSLEGLDRLNWRDSDYPVRRLKVLYHLHDLERALKFPPTIWERISLCEDLI